MTMTALTDRTARSPEPTVYLELAGRIDWLESGSGTDAADGFDVSEPDRTGLLWAA